MATNFGYKTLKTSGSVANSLNFVFIAEGFQAQDMPAFNQACLNFINTLSLNSPFLESMSLLNFYSIPVISSASGISHPCLWPTGQCEVVPAMPKTSIASYFGLSYDSNGIHRFICPNTAQVNNIEAVMNASIPLFSATADNVIPIVICNDTNYGGSEYGSVVCVTLNSLCEEVLLHELGHAIGGLDDEYIGGSEVESWNLTQNTNLATVRWAALEPQGAGLVQVGMEGWYKPTATCKMNTLGVGYCVVCRNQIYNGIRELITMAGGKPNVQLPLGNTVNIDPAAVATTPPIIPPPSAPTGLTTTGTDTISLTCAAVPGATNYTFTLNTGIVISSTTNSAAFTALLPKTAYSVTVTVTTANGTSQPSAPFNFTTP